MSRQTPNNHVVIGEPGIGKTAGAGGVEHRIVKVDVRSNYRTVSARLTLQRWQLLRSTRERLKSGSMRS